MCQPGKKIQLCTCIHKNQEKTSNNIYQWTLKKYAGSQTTGMDGMLIEPDHELETDLTDDHILAELNTQNCFDFDYVPNEGDNLEIYHTINHRFVSFIFKNQLWTIGSYNSFADKTEKVNSGKMNVE